MRRCILIPDRLAVRFNERLGDGQPESSAATLVELCEPLEDRFSLVRGNTGSFVGDGEFHVRVRARRLDGDDAVDGEWRLALSSRLMRTCPINSGSMLTAPNRPG